MHTYFTIAWYTTYTCIYTCIYTAILSNIVIIQHIHDISTIFTTCACIWAHLYMSDCYSVCSCMSPVLACIHTPCIPRIRVYMS